jgi:hypothetical protein
MIFQYLESAFPSHQVSNLCALWMRFLLACNAHSPMSGIIVLCEWGVSQLLAMLLPKVKGICALWKSFFACSRTLWLFLCTCAQYVTVQKHFSDPSLVIYIFSNPIHKTKTGTANRWETANSKPPLVNQKQGTTLRSYLLHSSLVGAQLCCTFY